MALSQWILQRTQSWPLSQNHSWLVSMKSSFPKSSISTACHSPWKVYLDIDSVVTYVWEYVLLIHLPFFSLIQWLPHCVQRISYFVEQKTGAGTLIHFFKIFCQLLHSYISIYFQKLFDQLKQATLEFWLQFLKNVYIGWNCFTSFYIILSFQPETGYAFLNFKHS